MLLLKKRRCRVCFHVSRRSCCRTRVEIRWSDLNMCWVSSGSAQVSCVFNTPCKRVNPNPVSFSLTLISGWIRHNLKLVMRTVYLCNNNVKVPLPNTNGFASIVNSIYCIVVMFSGVWSFQRKSLPRWTEREKNHMVSVQQKCQKSSRERKSIKVPLLVVLVWQKNKASHMWHLPGGVSASSPWGVQQTQSADSEGTTD